MEKNNGKIAIAIVAMFVVALSIVGVTYAYFVAGVQGNTGDDQRVIDVQAGILKVAYDNGDVLEAAGIVPGWKSDNDMVYNSIASVSTVDGETRITAVKNSTLTETQKTNGTTTAPVAPVTFTVTDESTEGETAYYGIRLVDVTNGLFAKEPNNFKVTITEATAGAITPTNGYTLTADGTQVVSEAIEIKDSATHTYTLSAEYVEAGSKQEGTGANVAFTVEVVGLQLVDGHYVDAEGNTWGA